MIELNDISKKYGDFIALDILNLKIEKHKISAIIGENGSGKSTLLNIIARFCVANTGEVLVDGVSSNEYENLGFARKLATLKQSNATNLRLKVNDFVSFGRYPHNQGRLSEEDHDGVRKALCTMQCETIKDKFLDELSGGQLQRVYIAMVLAQDTDYILLDEPLNNLDLKHAHELMSLIQTLVKDFGKTVVMIVHDLNMVYRYVDNIIALKEGRLICDGPVDVVLNEENLKAIYDLDFTIQKNHSHKIAYIE